MDQLLWSAFVLGLFSSLHCVAMCGPIALALPINRKNYFTVSFDILIYHLGRIFSYSALGFLIGLLGKGFSLVGFQQVISVVSGLFFILLFFIPLAKLENLGFSKYLNRAFIRLKSEIQSFLSSRDAENNFIVGLLNGFLPCGMVYAAVAGSLAMMNTFQSVLYMTLFGLGTTVMFTAFIVFALKLSGKYIQNIKKILPYFFLILGLLLIIRAMNLDIPYVSPLLNKAGIINQNCE